MVLLASGRESGFAGSSRLRNLSWRGTPGRIDVDDASRANDDADRRQIELPVVFGGSQHLFALPHEAPHFIDALLRSGLHRPGRIDTTLDSGLQRVAERQIQRYLAQYGDRGIHNVAA